MLDFNVVLSLFKSYPDPLSSENIPVEILTKYLSGLIIDFILRVNHDAVFGPRFIEYFADDFRVAGVDEDQAGH